ncbi:hypothetical protein ATCV1_z503L [Acanthocystis turfacea chlorella virus 1]|uniref:Uncharacterized protein z503L n=1 Tax=Chlorovirus heliozoae TaxID=322019 RepID=A7K9B3_9PHYC|nr:hypothetical protein ATCV1_z503L [Acanthocystis turfacea chlorella virus 1]ABT16637.1 hypothetical protein ATCV1_z503L [Acanthocystis turfacea chlorella virus 1]
MLVLRAAGSRCFTTFGTASWRPSSVTMPVMAFRMTSTGSGVSPLLYLPDRVIVLSCIGVGNTRVVFSDAMLLNMLMNSAERCSMFNLNNESV